MRRQLSKTLRQWRGSAAMAESLADKIQRKIENPSRVFERVMTCRYKGEDRSGVVIPYRSVLEFYSKELHYYFRDSNRSTGNARAAAAR